ncbi:CAP domain-containing protein [Collybia nuda]|uniref:CAP domain-containing protein n=1 Tax=Collybia nuda TaxID=64659 RepID=A0A9P5XYV6_9AGAR|nr:CAP domain-containing protein [Collybia nuda]
MTRFATFFSISLLITYIPGGFTGPACSRKHFNTADCVQRCKSRWGWSGKVMGTDPWGPVVQNSNQSLDAILSKACGSQYVYPSSISIPSGSLIVSDFTPTTSFVSSAPKESTTSLLSVIKTPTLVFTLSTTPTTASSHTSHSSSSSRPVVTRISSSQQEVSRVASFFPATTHLPSQTTPNFRPAPTTLKTSEPVSTPTPLSTGKSSASGSTPSNDIQAYLVGHNTARSRHGAVDLVWSDNLAAKAQQWANGCQFKHSGGSLGAFGENLAAGTGSSYGISTAIKSWTDEVGRYNPSNPQASHFTQVVWKATTQVGCALQSCDGIFDPSFGKAKFFVCEYSPAGNVNGQFAYVDCISLKV